jgi:hypothetical protein
VKYWGAMAGAGSHGFIDETFFTYLSSVKWPLIAGIIFSMPFAPFVSRKLCEWNAGLSRCLQAAAIVVLFILSAASTIRSAYNPFIYFNF